MSSKIKSLHVSTSSRTQLIDITSTIEKEVSKSGIKEGSCVLHVPHTTAAITINENADPSVRSDIVDALNKLIPLHGHYTHSEGNSDAHIKSSIIGCNLTLLIEQGQLLLGTWQGIYFCEFDGPRSRKLLLKIIPG